MSRITLQEGKTYAYQGTEGNYSVILGEIIEGDADSLSPISAGAGLPALAAPPGATIHFNTNNNKLYKKIGGVWDAGTSLTGSQGAPGPSGANGAAGPSGSAGQNGLSVRFGNGVPSSGLGINNEMYFDLTNFKVHTKASGSWDSGRLFRGTNGVNGTDGKSVRFGEGPPGAIGSSGDVYFDVTNLKFHTKADSLWDSGFSFRGEAGPTGSIGTTGATGLTGPTGLTGATGPGLNSYAGSISSDTTLTTSYARISFDEISSTGDILTKSTPVVGGGSRFTINDDGRYNIAVDAVFRAGGALSGGASYAPTCSVKIVRGRLSEVTVAEEIVGFSSIAAATPVNVSTETVVISKKMKLTAGDYIEIFAKTSSAPGAPRYSKLQAGGSGVDQDEDLDTIINITKL